MLLGPRIARPRWRRLALLLASACCGGLALIQLTAADAVTHRSAAEPVGRGPAAERTAPSPRSPGASESSGGGAAAGASSPLVAEGHQLFESSCSACHGLDAQGIDGRGPSLHGAGAAAAAFYLQTGRMPLPSSREQPQERRPAFPHDQIQALIAYVASFGGPPVPQVSPKLGSLSRGQELFALDCAGCHTIQGSGGIVTGAAVPSVQGASPKVIGEAIRVGPYVMPFFGMHDLSTRNVDSIARYVLSTQHPADLGGWGIGRIGPIPEGIVTWLLALVSLLLVARLLGERMPPRPHADRDREGED